MVATMLGVLHEQELRGERAENGLKRKAWIAVKESWKEAYQINLKATQLKTKWSNWKKDYEIYTAIKDNSGFEWDDQRAIPTAPESVRSAYLTAHPEAEMFRGRALIYYLILHELCANMSATGEFALSYNLSNYLHTASSSQASQPPQNSTVSYPATRTLVNPEREQVRWEGGRDSTEEEGQLERQEEQSTECREDGTTEGERSQQQRVGSDNEVSYGRRPEEESRMKIKAERKTAVGAIAQALDHLGATAQTIHESKTAIAVERLQNDYELRLTIDEKVKGFCVMENEVKAAVFTALQPGEAHHYWLMVAINSL
ncbi:hypothetical protein HOY82DRAFT_600577 [Tuber indicum]|nr:hypothetical protein HOY82DRAFT_600577 [Tuber indicum]